MGNSVLLDTKPSLKAKTLKESNDNVEIVEF